MIDWTKPIQQRDGGWAALKKLDEEAGLAIVVREAFGAAYVSNEVDILTGVAWPNGRAPYDIINVPETRTLDFWVNINQGGGHEAYSSKTDADEGAGEERIACIHVVQEYAVGEGPEGDSDG